MQQKVKPAPECFEDRPKPQQNELEEVDLATGEGTPKPTCINKELNANQKEELVKLLREYGDVFA